MHNDGQRQWMHNDGQRQWMHNDGQRQWTVRHIQTYQITEEDVEGV